jgi:hypothetical protein
MQINRCTRPYMGMTPVLPRDGTRQCPLARLVLAVDPSVEFCQ